MKNILSTLLLLVLALKAFSNPQIRLEDKIRISEAIDISNKFGDQIWNGFNDVPFVVVLVTDNDEFLINHPNPSDDFQFLEFDSLLNSKIYHRTRQFDKHLLATFPAVNGVNCIVVGTPENTNKNSTDWIITLLHEHFHQYEYSSPGYFKSVDDLGLSGGDQSGMWMLNYDFPYDSQVVIKKFNDYSQALSQVISNKITTNFQSDFNNYLVARNNFKNVLSPDDYRYFSFQVWQEGIARYTEYKFLCELKNYTPSKEVSSLHDFVSFDTYLQRFYKKQTSILTFSNLYDEKRVCFYSIGFAEGLLLDKINPNWKQNFLSDKFYVELYSEKFK